MRLLLIISEDGDNHAVEIKDRQWTNLLSSDVSNGILVVVSSYNSSVGVDIIAFEEVRVPVRNDASGFLRCRLFATVFVFVVGV